MEQYTTPPQCDIPRRRRERNEEKKRDEIMRNEWEKEVEKESGGEEAEKRRKEKPIDESSGVAIVNGRLLSYDKSSIRRKSHSSIG